MGREAEVRVDQVPVMDLKEKKSEKEKKSKDKKESKTLTENANTMDDHAVLSDQANRNGEDMGTKKKVKSKSKSKDKDKDKEKEKEKEKRNGKSGEKRKAVDSESSSASEEPRVKKSKSSEGKDATDDRRIHLLTKSSFSNDEVSEFRTKYNIDVFPEDAGKKYVPIKKFGDTQLPGKLLTVTRDFAAPTPIQSQSIPIALDGKDLIAIARTGSGKTLAFGLPAMYHVMQNCKDGRALSSNRVICPMVIALSPTRELAIQIAAVLKDAGRHCSVSCSVVFGGVPKVQQLREVLEERPHILIATPGRLMDFLEEGKVSLESVSFAVLDEADRMLDLGFEREVKTIMTSVIENKQSRQTLMFSATWPESVRQLARKYLREEETIKVSVGGSGEKATASRQVQQQVIVLDDQRLKDVKLGDLLRKHPQAKMIVFALYKKEASRVEQTLLRKNVRAVSIHGDKSQNDRMSALKQFVDNEANILVATDVAARGLDIPDVDVVVNYTFPLTIEDYVHRIGRTGRGDRNGISYTFFTDHEKGLAGSLVSVLKESGQDVPQEMSRFALITKKKEHSMYGAFSKENIAGSATRITFDHSDDEE